MPRANRTCKICGVSYYYCAHCNQAKSGKQGYEPWRILVHDENCHNIFKTLQSHSLNKISDKEAASQLESYDLSVINAESIKAQVDAIMASAAKKTRARKTKTISESSNEEEVEIQSSVEEKEENKEGIIEEQDVSVDEETPMDVLINAPE